MWIFGELWIPNWVVYLSITIFLIYVHYVRTFSFWKKQGVPGPTPFPLIGNISPFARKIPAHDIEMRDFKRYGRVFGRYEGSDKILVVNDPDLLKQILVKDFHVFRNRRNFAINDELFLNGLFFQKDDEWKTSRRIFSAVFSAGKLKKMSRLTNWCGKDLAEMFQEKAKDGKSFKVNDMFRVFALNNLARCIFGIDIDARDPNSQFVKHAKKVFELSFSVKLVMLFMFPKLASLLKFEFPDKEVRDFFCGIIQRVFEERKKEKVDRVDFVQICLEASGDGTEEEKKHSLSHQVICSQAFAFMFGGYETTVMTLGFAAYHCAINPEIQERLIEEIKNAVDKHGEISYESIQDMHYLSAVFDETLRMYPAAVRGDRICSQDYQLGSVFVPKGAVVSFSEYVLHRDPEFWNDPDTFNPERFFHSENINQYAYFPFLHGPRNCIAKRFALMTMKLCLAQVLTKIRFRRSPTTPVPLEFKASIDSMSPKTLDLMAELHK